MNATPNPCDDVPTAVVSAIAAHLGDDAAGAGTVARVILAVSGGRDSMVLLHAMMAHASEHVAGVATFDHATGAHATAAATFVQEAAAALGVEVVAGRSERVGRTEAAWRDARWRFLRETAATLGATAVATAHTRDDQCETVAMRAMRGAGARGLAALAAPMPGIVRPLLTVSRAAVAAYAVAHDVTWLEDPSNTDRRHLRARVRADLLPAIARVRPEAPEQLFASASAAARSRAAVDRWVGAMTDRACVADGRSANGPTRVPVVPVLALARCPPTTLATFWPAFAARAGVRLDRRAIARLVDYTQRVVVRIRDGSVQPGAVPIAGVSGPGARDGDRGARHVVALDYGSVMVAGDGGQRARAWHFVVRPDGRGVAVRRSPDYA